MCRSLQYIKFNLKRLVISVGLFFTTSWLSSQDIQWQVLSPQANSVVSNNNLFVSVVLNNYELSPDAVILLDGVPLIGNMKISGNRISFLHFGLLQDGLHRLTIKTFIKKVKKNESYTWSFYVNKKDDTLTAASSSAKVKDKVGFSGSLLADNRNTWLSGPGKELRQEPDYSRTVSLVSKVKYKNAEIPIKIYATTDNRFLQQSGNFYQVGYHNKWMELDVGDMNPNFDRLILTGVRVRGARLKVKIGKTSLQAIYGDLVQQPREGVLQRYNPGAGYLPTTFINDTQYVEPGIYKRWMAGGRAEIVMMKENLKLGFLSFKAKDKINSIQYGFQPKDNLATGIDVTLRLFKKSVTFHSSFAASVLTNDISYGVLQQDYLRKPFNIKFGFDPNKYSKYIIINASTVPTGTKSIKDAMASYTQLNYKNKYQSLSVEYRSIGALYNSLGNPFLRNNYKGVGITERFSLLQRKINLNISYQQYVNNLNQSLQSKINTNMLNTSAVISVNEKYPTAVLSYVFQNRNSENEIKPLYALKDKLQNYMLNLNYHKTFWTAEHNFRFSINYNSRKNFLRNQDDIKYFNYILGINEYIRKSFTVNAELGKTLVKNAASEKIANINTYSLFAGWQAKSNNLNTSIGLSNNRAHQTLLTPDSYRLTAILKFGYKFYKTMNVDIEAGYVPYKEKINIGSNFDEKYIYLRYSYDFNFY